MLNHISPVFSPELLAAVYAMGHGDTIVLADGNFPSDGVSRRGAAEIIRADGHGIPELLDAILALMPLDTYTEKPVLYMQSPSVTAILRFPFWTNTKRSSRSTTSAARRARAIWSGTRSTIRRSRPATSCRAARPRSMRTSSCRRASSSGISDRFFLLSGRLCRFGRTPRFRVFGGKEKRCQRDRSG